MGGTRIGVDRTDPTSAEAECVHEARRERMRGEYENAVKLAAAYGMRLLGNDRAPYGCYVLTVNDQVELRLKAATGALDANDLTVEQCDRLARNLGRPPVQSLLAMVESVIAVLGLRPVAVREVMFVGDVD